MAIPKLITHIPRLQNNYNYFPNLHTKYKH
jgi:hypothetical protein